METGRFLSSDGKSNIHYELWLPQGKPVAVLQIIHGMCEYIHRYEDLALYLNESGIAVVGDDHIGHGHSSSPDDYGYFGEQDGWIHMCDDIEKLRCLMAERFEGIPYIMMGHSMGSFLCRAWLARYGSMAAGDGKLAGSVICGTAGSNPALGPGLALCKAAKALKGGRARSKFITGLAFGSYTKDIESPRTDHDWLTCDNAVVDAYMADPMCGFEFTLAGYQDLFTLLKYISTEQCYKALPKQLPYLLIAGLADPVGAYGKGVTEVRDKMEAVGCSDVSEILYQDMRHEVFNEIGRETVWEDIRDFCLDMSEEAV